jgi:protein TonB
MDARDFNRFFLISVMAILVNILLFTGLPNFLKSDFSKTDIEDIQVVDFLRKNPHRNIRKKEKKEPEKPPPKERPKVIPKKQLTPKQHKPKPMKMKMPRFDFDVQPDMNLGVAVAPPPPPPPEPEPEPAQIVAPPAPGLKDFYGSQEVDQIPLATMKTKPIYPYRARRLNLDGKVDVRFLVDKRGWVGQISILRANPAKLFDSSVLKALSSWRFKPGMVRGTPVNTWVTTTIVFRIDDL